MLLARLAQCLTDHAVEIGKLRDGHIQKIFDGGFRCQGRVDYALVIRLLAAKFDARRKTKLSWIATVASVILSLSRMSVASISGVHLAAAAANSAIACLLVIDMVDLEL